MECDRSKRQMKINLKNAKNERNREEKSNEIGKTQNDNNIETETKRD